MFRRLVGAILTALVICAFVILLAPGVRADSPVKGGDLHQTGGVSIDQNYVPTAKDQEVLAAKTRQINKMKEEARTAQDPATTLEGLLKSKGEVQGSTAESLSALSSVKTTSSSWYFRMLSQEKKWREPSDAAHRNYCGPGSTQVVLDVRLAARDVPSIDTIGQEERVDRDVYGVTDTAIRDTVNRHLNSQWYIVSRGVSSDYLNWATRLDLDLNYGMAIGVRTGGMPGWGSRDVQHVVAILGLYDSSGNRIILYADTAASDDPLHPSYQGNNGSYYNWVPFDSFYYWHSRNATLIW